MPDREKFTPPDVTPHEAEAQSIIRKLLDLLKTVKMFLELIYSRLPDPPDAEDMGDGRIPESLTFSLRSSIECVLVDHLDPLIRSLSPSCEGNPAVAHSGIATPAEEGTVAMATITVEVTDKQWNRWRTAAGVRPDLGAFLAKAGDFYAARLQARLELARRMEREGRL